MTGEEKRLPEADEPLEPVHPERAREHGMLSRALGMYLELPRKVQLALLSLLLAAAARATGLDERLVRLAFGSFAESGPSSADSPNPDAERADQEELDVR